MSSGPPKKRDFEKKKNLEIGICWIKFMEDNLNLDLDKINHFGAETDSDQSRTRSTT